MSTALYILRPDDADEISTLHASGFDPGWSPSEFAGLLAEPHNLALGRGSDDRLDAFVLVAIVGTDAEIVTLATRPDARRKGHALALLKALLSRLGERGAARLFLDVAEDNAPAISLYRSLGFQPTGQRKAYYRRATGAPVDALLMTLELGLGSGLDRLSQA